MLATIDVGSNTLRMLLGQGKGSKVQPWNYYRQITRLGGGYCNVKGLAPESMERTLCALEKFKQIVEKQSISKLRMVGTAALRRAINRHEFVVKVKERTGFSLEIISGEEEAKLTCAGVLSVLEELPENALIVDIGGGSTELICFAAGRPVLHKSYPLGVVRLCEECVSEAEMHQMIRLLLDRFQREVDEHTLAIKGQDFQLIGTAGTLTTLAAIQQKMTVYDWRKINNHLLPTDWLLKTRQQLALLSVAERENLPGMEAGRGDLILPGLSLLLALLNRFDKDRIRVADAGLLEGVMLDLGDG